MVATKLQLWLVFSVRDHMRIEMQKVVRVKRRLIDLSISTAATGRVNNDWNDISQVNVPEAWADLRSRGRR
jgi:hypothetical protein